MTGDGRGPEGRPVSQSEVVLAQQMELEHSNLAGNVHGGVIMRLVDTAAGLAAAKHCGRVAVTVAMDDMSFIEPVFLGDIVTVRAMVNDTGTTSMEVGVRVEAENVHTGRHAHTSSAYLVFVALDAEGRPTPVPPAVAETEEQRQRQREAKLRREARLARKEAILKVRASRGE
ncbi:MAG TPA: acyl-CoA thioesterase [Actinomycetota bacterium]|nr:acyl-CoA thioesterase [Actinomycetota bacterium]